LQSSTKCLKVARFHKKTSINIQQKTGQKNITDAFLLESKTNELLIREVVVQ